MILNHHVLPQAPQNISYATPLQSRACSIAGHYEVSAFGPCLKGVCGSGEVTVACDVDEVGDEGVGVVDYVAKSGLVESSRSHGEYPERYCGVFDGERNWVVGACKWASVEVSLALCFRRKESGFFGSYSDTVELRLASLALGCNRLKGTRDSALLEGLDET